MDGPIQLETPVVFCNDGRGAGPGVKPSGPGGRRTSVERTPYQTVAFT